LTWCEAPQCQSQRRHVLGTMDHTALSFRLAEQAERIRMQHLTIEFILQLTDKPGQQAPASGQDKL